MTKGKKQFKVAIFKLGDMCFSSSIKGALSVSEGIRIRVRRRRRYSWLKLLCELLRVV